MRAIGGTISSETEIYKKLISGKIYYGRIFIVNRWYIATYKPIKDKTGYIIGVISLGLPEETELLKETSYQGLEEGILLDNTFKHNF